MSHKVTKKKEKITVSVPGPILPGTISTVISKCGKPNCACKADPPRLHGPYFRWTGFINGKPTTKTISKEIAEECKRHIKNYQKLQAKIKSLVDKSLINAPWSKK